MGSYFLALHSIKKHAWPTSGGSGLPESDPGAPGGVSGVIDGVPGLQFVCAAPVFSWVESTLIWLHLVGDWWPVLTHILLAGLVFASAWIYLMWTTFALSLGPLRNPSATECWTRPTQSWT